MKIEIPSYVDSDRNIPLCSAVPSYMPNGNFPPCVRPFPNNGKASATLTGHTWYDL